jgi:hypothetical protein
MKPTALLSALLLLLCHSAIAQRIDVDRKSGLVTIDGREYCYIVPASKGSVKQFNVQNLLHQDLIFVSENEAKQYNRESQTFEGDDYRLVFLGTHNWATANSGGFGYNNYQKIARMLFRERLLEGNAVVPESERLFIRARHGIFVTRIEPGTIAIQPNTATVPVKSETRLDEIGAAESVPAHYLKDDKFYTGTRAIGSFTRSKTGPETVNIYSTDDTKVASAVHNGDEWTLSTSDGKRVTLRYYSNSTIERLFEYLISKGYLK